MSLCVEKVKHGLNSNTVECSSEELPRDKILLWTFRSPAAHFPGINCSSQDQFVTPTHTPTTHFGIKQTKKFNCYKLEIPEFLLGRGGGGAGGGGSGRRGMGGGGRRRMGGGAGGGWGGGAGGAAPALTPTSELRGIAPIPPCLSQPPPPHSQSCSKAPLPQGYRGDIRLLLGYHSSHCCQVTAAVLSDCLF